MIQEGALLPVVSSKNPPTHWVLDICASLKSAGLIDQLGPPNEMATLTSVVQAVVHLVRIMDATKAIITAYDTCSSHRSCRCLVLSQEFERILLK